MTAKRRSTEKATRRPEAPPTPRLRGPLRRLLALAALAGLALVVAAGALLWHLRPEGRGGRGAGLGPLPDGLAPGDLNLVLVTLDTTRADRLGCYGARQVATPNLDRLAARGVVFESAVSPTPLTLPAHCSLLTGLLPGAHGVRDNGGYELAPEHLTLAEVLRERGWATGGFVAAYVLDHRWGIAQGFDRYFDDFDLSKQGSVSMGDIQRPGDQVVSEGLAWMGGLGGKRFFAWIHLYDPHTPYAPPEPFASRYAGRPYNGEIAWTDEVVGRLLAGLDRLGVAGRTVVAVVGDHGESLGEHGENGHGFFVYEPTTRVPFLLAGPYPGLAGRRVAAVVRHTDLMPTVLDLLGVAAPPRGQGRTLVPVIVGPAGEERPESPDSEEGDAASAAAAAVAGYSEAYYPRLHYGWSELRAVRTERWHFIEAPRPELYDLAADPGERTNLAASERRVVARLRRVLAEIERTAGPNPHPADTAGARPARPVIEEDEETLRKLAALGYVGSIAETAGKPFHELPDPKDRIAVYNLIDRARDETVAGETGRAIATLREVLAADPEVIDAWFMLGNAHFQERDWQRAADSFRATLKRRPDHDYAVIGLADTLVATGRVDDAVLGYRRFLEKDADNAQITYRLAQVLLDAGREEEAEPWLRRTLAIEPRTARAEVGLGLAAFRRGDLAGARRALARALAIDPEARHAHYNLALVLEAEGDLPGAARAYRAEVAARPDAYRAWFNLGRLLGRTGDRPGSLDALRRAVAANPELGVGHLYLAQALLEAGDLAGAMSAARRGLELAGDTPQAALGHYVLADALNRQGRRAEAEAELRRGREAEKKGERRAGG